MAHSTASAPELVKKTWPSWPVASASSRSTSIAARVATGLANRLLTWSSSPRLVGDRRGDGGVGVAEADHGEAAEEVEVALAVDVPQLGAAAADEHHLGRPEHGHERAGGEVVGREGVGGHVCSSHHGADPFVGEDLQQQDVGDPAVEDVGAADAVAHGADAAGDLGDHAAGDRAVGDQRVELVGRRLADQARRVVDVAAQALDVGEVDELLRAQRLGDGAGDDVGVDVVRLAGLVGADRGDDGDELVVEQAVEDGRVDRGDIADEAELRAAGGGADQPGVLAADPDGVVAVQVDRRHQLRVDLADQHHAGDVDGLGVGDAQAVAELGGLAQPLHQRADLRAAAVDDDGAHADEAHQHDVLGEQVEGVVLGRAGEGVAAVLDDDRLAGEAPDVRQRLDQDVRDVHGVPRPRRPVLAARSLALARSHRWTGRRLTATPRPAGGRGSRRGRGRRWPTAARRRTPPWSGCRARRGR